MRLSVGLKKVHKTEQCKPDTSELTHHHRYRRRFINGCKGAITSKIKHAIKLKESPARLAPLLQPSLGRPEQPFRTGLCFTADVFLFFFSPRFLRHPSTDRPETLPHDQNLAVFYKLTSETRGCSPQKIWGPKTCKISVTFGPLQTLLANISGTRQHIQNRKDVRTRKIPPAFNKKVRWTLVH